MHSYHLLVDNSNTRTKMMRVQGGRLLPEKRIIETADITAPRLAHLLQGWRYDSCVICSVVPAAHAALKEGIACPCHFLAWDSPHGVSFEEYPDREHLGADRIANVIALQEWGRKAAIAVDLGTAITYDVLEQRDGKAYFKGGVIAPGLASLREYLSVKTALLPSIEWALPESAIGRCTQEAMQAGVALGFRGMIRETLAELRAELGTRPYVVATGGDAKLASSLLNHIDELDEDLTFKGLQILLRALLD